MTDKLLKLTDRVVTAAPRMYLYLSAKWAQGLPLTTRIEMVQLQQALTALRDMMA
jgi:hypothetical protein